MACTALGNTENASSIRKAHYIHHTINVVCTSSQETDHHFSLDISIQIQPDPRLEIESDPNLQALIPLVLVAHCRKRFTVGVNRQASLLGGHLVVGSPIGFVVSAVLAASLASVVGGDSVLCGQIRGGAEKWVSDDGAFGETPKAGDRGNLLEHSIGHLREIKSYCNWRAEELVARFYSCLGEDGHARGSR